MEVNSCITIIIFFALSNYCYYHIFTEVVQFCSSILGDWEYCISTVMWGGGRSVFIREMADVRTGEGIVKWTVVATDIRNYKVAHSNSLW